MAQYSVDDGSSADQGPLTDRVFAAHFRKAAPADAKEPANEPGREPALFEVGRTRKGRWDVGVERRAGGKVVTVIRNVRGDAGALLTLLRRRCGAGGVARDGMVEVQGDHRGKVEAILRAL